MRRLIVLALCATGGLFWSTPAHAALEVRLTVKPLSPLAGTRALIELRTYSPLIRADGSCCRLAPADPVGYPFRVEAVSPAGDMTRVRVRRARRSLWRGTFRFPTPGRWQVRVANYGPTYEHAPGARPRIWVRVRQRQATTPPSSFGPLGSPGCSPPSPRNRAGDNASRAEVFGTAVGGSFWGLFLFMPSGDTWASDDSAAFQNILGKEIKIVFKLNDLPSQFYAVAPDGTRTPPVWGPSVHTSSTWQRDGVEWGAGFVFDRTGCWDIHAQYGAIVGDIWLDVRS